MWRHQMDNLTLKYVLDELPVVGARRHLLIELFFVLDLDEWGRPSTEEHFAELLRMPVPEARELLRGMVQDDLITCAQDMKTGQVSGIGLSDEFMQLLSKKRADVETGQQQHRGPRPPTAGVGRRAHELFEETCELCGDRAVRGRDQRGGKVSVARIKKDLDGIAENVTLLCSGCLNQTRGRDLPSECRTLRVLEIAEERGYEHAPRTAVAPPKPLKEIVLVATGPISVKTRNHGPDGTDGHT